MTGSKSKFRAVFLSALMVLSVFGGAIAFSGGAAAVTNVSSDSINGGTLSPSEGSTVTYDNVTFNLVDLNNNNSGQTVNVELGFDNGGEIVSTSGVSSNISSSSGTNQDGNLTFTLTPSSSNKTASVTVDDLEVAYPLVSANQDTNLIASVDDTGGDNADYTIGNTITIQDDASNEDIAEKYGADAAYDYDSIEGNLVWKGQEIAVYNVTPNTQIQLQQKTGDDSFSTRVQRTSDANGVVVFDTSSRSEDSYRVRDPDAASASGAFDITTQYLDASFEDDTVNNEGSESTVDLEMDSNRGTFNVNVTESDEDLSPEDLEDIFQGAFTVTDPDTDDEVITISGVSGGDTYSVDFDGIDAGDYNLNFSVTDTTAEDTSSITVEEVSDGSANFANSTVIDQQGDYVPITVEVSGADDTASLVIGDYSEDGYQYNATVVDDDNDGKVKVYFNTYRAGQGHDDLLELADSDDAIENQEEHPSASIDGLLDAGDYDVYTMAGDDQNDNYTDVINGADDVMLLSLTESSLNNMTTWVAPSGSEGNFEDLDELMTAVEDGDLTQTSTAAKGDRAVFALDAGGLSGLYNASESGDVTSEFENAVNNSNVTFHLNQTNPQQNRPAAKLNVTQTIQQDALKAIADPANNTYYVIVSTGTASFDRGTTTDVSITSSALDLRDDAEFNGTVTVKDQALLGDDERGIYSDEDDWEDISSMLTLQDRDADFDSDPVEVQSASDQSITGTATVAPGTELTIRTSATGDNAGSRFVKSTTVTVTENQTWSATFDFSDVDAGTEFDARLSGSNVPQVTVDGNVVEQQTTTTSTTSTTTSTTSTTTSTTSTTTSATSTTTSTTSGGTPGFGAGVALVALAGAALLALRRDN
ncbi:hypothetical protein GCM10009037_17230 [Halarchaeum grantii]|uniref:Cadherin domain-containing protein n=1 Tax=Halarchaeum grantii TaxID=1193105 RepID=A0A830F9Z7_9EURY|nr:BGTF surface domain-containing protein [Halarchaeum grantii]GGL34179.1 hypothetical protein GCM10009037_17230 [Halarchaeum grantii]